MPKARGVATKQHPPSRNVLVFIKTQGRRSRVNCKGFHSYPLKKSQEIMSVLLNTQSASQFSRSVMSDSLWPHEPQHTRPPCPSPTPGVHSNSCPSSRWCHPTISSSVIPFSSCPQSFPASGSFQMSQLFTSGGQSIGVSIEHQSCQWTPRTNLF